MTVTERVVQRALFLALRSSSLLISNYTPSGWSECDLAALTKAGRWHEYEIKLTAADFRADAGKTCWRSVGHYRLKHELLTEGDVRGPNQFWYVLPESLLTQVEVPAWAGIKVIHAHPRSVGLTTHRPAKILHTRKIDPKVLRHARGVFYWRFWRERLLNDQLRQKEK